MATCYRHPDRETNVACSNCDRPICPDCMTSTPVGMRCPECARQRTKVHRGTGGGLADGVPTATLIFMSLCIAAFVGQVGSGGQIYDGVGSLGVDGGVLGYGVNQAGFVIPGLGIAEGEWYRLLTGGFLHSGIIHLGLNMLALYFLGRLLEPAIGSWRFAGIYLVSLLGGSAGAVLVEPDTLTVGASGAVFGLMAAAFFEARSRGMHDIASQIGFYVILNLVITVSVPNISLGGHVGGLITGGALTLLLSNLRSARGRAAQPLEIGILVGAAVGLAIAGVLIADAAFPAGPRA